MKTTENLTTQTGRSNLLSTYVKDATRYGAETVIYELAKKHSVECEDIMEALNLATMGR